MREQKNEKRSLLARKLEDLKKGVAISVISFTQVFFLSLFLLFLPLIVAQEIDETHLIYRDNLAYDGRTGEILNGKVMKKSDLGSVLESRTYKDGLPDGLWQWYTETGLMAEKGVYRAGLRDGEWEWFYESGTLRKKGKFVDDKENGPWEEYHEDGKLKKKGNFIYGDLDGMLQEFRESGRLKQQGGYLAGQKDGEWEHFDRIGRLVRTDTYIDGELVDCKGACD